MFRVLTDTNAKYLHTGEPESESIDDPQAVTNSPAANMSTLSAYVEAVRNDAQARG